MYTFVTRNLDAGNLEEGSIQPITAVKREQDPAKQIKGEKLFLYNGEKCLGCLATQETSLLPATESAAGLSDANVIGHALMSRRRSSAEYTFCKMELFPAKDIASDETGNNQEKCENQKEDIVLLIGGTRTSCPGKADLLGRLKNGEEVVCSLMRDFEDLVVYDSAGRSCGKLFRGQELPDLFAKQLTVEVTARSIKDKNRWKKLLAEAFDKKRIDLYEVVISSQKKIDSGIYEDKIDELNNRCIAHPADVRERIAYLENMGVPERLIRKILDSYMEYPIEEFMKIKKPNHPFIDSRDGYLSRCIVYMLTGENIRLVGSKGCGKNTLLDTLSWIFNQPLYKIGCSERTDEYTIFGSTQVKNGDTIHRLSPFAHGLTIGAICILDEANMASPELLSVINQLTDDTREVDINNYGKLKLHGRTRVFMTMNENYQGVVIKLFCNVYA